MEKETKRNAPDTLKIDGQTYISKKSICNAYGMSAQTFDKKLRCANIHGRKLTANNKLYYTPIEAETIANTANYRSTPTPTTRQTLETTARQLRRVGERLAAATNAESDYKISSAVSLVADAVNKAEQRTREILNECPEREKRPQGRPRKNQ